MNYYLSTIPPTYEMVVHDEKSYLTFFLFRAWNAFFYFVCITRTRYSGGLYFNLFNKV